MQKISPEKKGTTMFETENRVNQRDKSIGQKLISLIFLIFSFLFGGKRQREDKKIKLILLGILNLNGLKK